MKPSFNLSELDSVAKNLIDSLSTKIIRIDGIMGSGKTTLISSACKHLNIQDEISSPTFSIVNTYSSPKDQFITLIFIVLKTQTKFMTLV